MPVSGDNYKDQVRTATDIVELIGRTVALKRRGRDYVGLCPFHQEKSPSFTVSPTKQIFFCYGCKAGGDVFSFVEKRDRVEFREALRILGEAAGIEAPQGRGDSGQKNSEKQALLEMQSAACAFFEKLLAHPEDGKAARDYLLNQRQINAESVKRFQIGLAPDAWDALLRSPIGRKFTGEQLASAGLVKPRNNGEGFYDTFRSRLMFPIRDQEARVIAFGGRQMPGGTEPKYLNSPETPLFVKSRCLFGIDLARQKLVESRTAVIVEGYTDVVVAHQCGATNVVSPLGTALTEQHVTILRRFADRIVLLFDGDIAGDAAVDRSVALFLTQPVEIAIASMPGGLDPDEFLLQQGLDAFTALVNGATDALAYKWKQLARQFEASDENLTGQQRAVEAYLDVLGSARGSGPVDALRWGGALTRVSRLTGIPVEQLNSRFKGKRPKPVQQVSAAAPDDSQPAMPMSRSPARPLTAQDRAEKWLLGCLLLEPGRWQELQKVVHVEDFAHEGYRRLAEMYWNHQRDEGEPVFNEFFGALRDPELTELVQTAVDEVEAIEDRDGMIRDALAFFDRLSRVREEQKLVAMSRRINDAGTTVDDDKLLRDLSERRRTADLRRT
jgi:DNA primase